MLPLPVLHYELWKCKRGDVPVSGCFRQILCPLLAVTWDRGMPVLTFTLYLHMKKRNDQTQNLFEYLHQFQC